MFYKYLNIFKRREYSLCFKMFSFTSEYLIKKSAYDQNFWNKNLSYIVFLFLFPKTLRLKQQVYFSGWLNNFPEANNFFVCFLI